MNAPLGFADSQHLSIVVHLVLVHWASMPVTDDPLGLLVQDKAPSCNTL